MNDDLGVDSPDTGDDGTQPNAASTTDAGAGGSAAPAGDYAQLDSRYRGQTAKVNELTGQLKAEADARKAAEQRLADYESGKLGESEAHKAALEAERARAAAAEAKAVLAELKVTYPEAYAEVGDAIAGLPKENLASLEARLTAAKSEDEGDEGEPPTPKRHNEPKTGDGAGRSKKEPTAADIEAELLSLPNPFAT